MNLALWSLLRTRPTGFEPVAFGSVDRPGNARNPRRRAKALRLRCNRRCNDVCDHRGDRAKNRAKDRSAVSRCNGGPKRKNPRSCRGFPNGASRTRIGDLLGAIRGAHRLNMRVLQGDLENGPVPSVPEIVRNLRDFAGVLARGGVRVAKPRTAARSTGQEARPFLGAERDVFVRPEFEEALQAIAEGDLNVRLLRIPHAGAPALARRAGASRSRDRAFPGHTATKRSERQWRSRGHNRHPWERGNGTAPPADARSCNDPELGAGHVEAVLGNRHRADYARSPGSGGLRTVRPRTAA